MARVEEPGRNLWRLVGRGREETTPMLSYGGVALLVAVLAGVIVGLVFLAGALA